MKEFSIGDNVTVAGKQLKYTGIVMPSSEDSVLVLKLNSGYNVGILKEKIERRTLIQSAKKVNREIAKLKQNSNLPKISIISTGGTITSKVDYKTGGVSPLTNPEELIANIPELEKLANIKLISPFSKLSENMSPEDWQTIADTVVSEINRGVEGVIVTHGTDTLHFTASALSFMIKDLSKPVALVGGQRSSDRGGFDGAQNLICAVHYCLSQIAEVVVIMHANTDDDFCYALRGTKVRKMHSSRRDAFRPINCLPLAKIYPKGKVEIIEKNYNNKKDKRVKLANQLETKVALIKYSPGLSPDVLGYYIDKGYKGLILEGTGFGHVSEDWIKQLKWATKQAIVCMTTQTIYGGTNNYIYSMGIKLHKAGVIYCKDTLAETAYVKLMHLLGTHKNLEEIKIMMQKNIAGEINERIVKKSFLY
jgi:glutamyl-tRNA(Gln) amidotransferase subunit D